MLLCFWLPIGGVEERTVHLTFFDLMLRLSPITPEIGAFSGYPNCLFVAPSSLELCAFRITTSPRKKPKFGFVSVSCSSAKIARSRSIPLDKNVTSQNRIRFVQKLKSLILSTPSHYIPLHILSKYHSYLSQSEPSSVLDMISRYPSVFQLCRIAGTSSLKTWVCVCLTQEASALAAREWQLQRANSVHLAEKLQKLLMLSSHGRLVLWKLVHLAFDLGLPANFRSSLCNGHPEKFKTIDTSFGIALQLVSWDSQLAVPLPSPKLPQGMIVERPFKFKHLRLRKGLNVKRCHQELLVKFGEIPDVCPYNTRSEKFAKESMEFEKRACSVVREVLGMMSGKRTLIDHLALFRKEFGLPNKLRAMILRHPELFYVSFRGVRDSVFLLDGFDENGVLLEKDESMAISNEWVNLVAESKRMRQQRRHIAKHNKNVGTSLTKYYCEFEGRTYDGFENVFGSNDESLVTEYDGYADTDVSHTSQVASKEPW